MYGTTGDVEEQGLASPTSSWTGRGIIIVLVICFEWASAVLQSLMVTDVVAPTHYFHKDRVLCNDPLALTGIINGIAAGFALMLWKGSEAFQRIGRSNSSTAFEGTALTWRQLGLFMLSGICEGFERGLANLSLTYISMSLRTMLSSTGIFFTFAFTILFKLESVESRRVCAVVVLVVGGVVQGLGMRTGIVSLLGVCIVMISVFAGALRWSIINLAMSLSPRGAPKMMLSDKFKIMAISKPFDCALCIFISLAYGTYDWSPPEAELVKMWLLMGLNIFIVVFFELLIIQYTSAVANGVVLIIANIWIVLCGVRINRERASTWQCIGFGICIVGSIMYTTAASRPSKTAKEEAAVLHDEKATPKLLLNNP
mmetsp:Transcript_21999/g.46809  ORF Transcript_21999/g.46809 Transcript_21999/m.46809 type:complete len:370 (-) Transcript_21999:65-1174(-)